MSPIRQSRQPVMGTCRLCSSWGQLSFEHVPPQSAFNDEPVLAIVDGDMFSIGPDEEVSGRIQQRGAGGHTLCIKCNPKLGRWYGGVLWVGA